MYRGIKGAFIYACNKDLNEYLKRHIQTYKAELPFRILPFNEVKPYVNAVPLVDISAAAGGFSDLQIHRDFDWVELPFTIAAKEGHFVCKVVGESMNKIIPNGSYCLFRQDQGGTRNGKTVLVESIYVQDSDFGSGYTVKEYHSEKKIDEEGWKHDSITLKPLSTDDQYENIHLTGDELNSFKVVGIFDRVITF